MRISHAGAAVALVLLEVGLAPLGVTVHYGFLAAYGDVSDSAGEGLLSGFSTGVVGPALVLVTVAALVAARPSSKRWLRVMAETIPLLMLVAMLGVTPAALSNKLEVQYAATPQCVVDEDSGPGPGLAAERESQRAFDSITHVGNFGGGGGVELARGRG